MVRDTDNNCRCVDLRTGAFDVPPQEILTRDSVTINVDAVVYYQVNVPDMTIIRGSIKTACVADIQIGNTAN